MLTPERIFVVQINEGEGISIGVLYRPDQHGNVDIYTNFQSSIQEDQKYLLNHDTNGIANCKLAAFLTLIL